MSLRLAAVAPNDYFGPPVGAERCMVVSSHDRNVLRRLAGRVREIAELPEMGPRKERWYRHNALKGQRPMVLCFPEGGWEELLPQTAMECEDANLRGWEWQLRSRVLWWEHIHDDNTLEPFFDINWHVDTGDYGVTIRRTQGANRGSYVWDPPIKDIARDMSKLRPRQFKVDRQATHRAVEKASEIFGDLLPVRIRGSFWWTMGLTQTAIFLMGLEPLMLAPYDDPDGLHALMTFLRDDHLRFIEWTEREGLLTAKNSNDYVGSGGVGYTHELPSQPVAGQNHIRLRDIWGFAESQETVGISPQQFAQFILPYQAPLLEKFGLNCYGCCEPLERRMADIERCVPRLRRVSVAPLSNEEKMAELCAGKYIYSRKPDPAKVCVDFDEQGIRRELRRTLAIAGRQPLELILKDTHTFQNDPSRVTRWVRITLEEVDRYISGGG